MSDAGRGSRRRGLPAFMIDGTRVDALTFDAAVDELLTMAREGGSASVHLVNAYTIALSSDSPPLQAALNAGDLNLPDGWPVAWVGRRHGAPVAGPVPGPDLFGEVCDRGQAAGLGHFFYGSTEDTLSDLTRNLSVKLPDIRISGSDSPPFRPLSEDEIDSLARRISDSGANLVWVALGTPKQDFFVERLKARVEVPVVAVGAAFDFHAGRVRRAPRWVQRIRLEWLFRLVMEPRRLWRRYLIGNVKFLRAVRNGVRILEP